MKEPVFYTFGSTDALIYARKNLEKKGFHFADTPSSDVTDLLLDVPLRSKDITDILPQLSPDVKIYGGFLGEIKGFDLLEDPLYVAENARITAYGAVSLASRKLPVTLYNCPALVIGWGRIGKCLAQLLQAMGAKVSVYARKEKDQAMINALGYDLGDLHYGLCRYRVIFNTVPFMVLPKENLQFCREDCLKIELASSAGMEGDDVILAKGLPNNLTPESSGELIARTVLRLKGGTL